MVNTPLLPAVEINPSILPAKAAVIWLHGLGADGHDFANIVPALHIPPELAVRFVFPHAPARPVTLNNGMVMPAWFDVLGLQHGSPIDESGVHEAGLAIGRLMTREVERGVPTNKIVLAGFSQGGALALATGLNYPQPLAGILGLSTFLPITQPSAQQFNSANKNTPVMLVHGTLDQVVGYALGEMSCQHLIQLGYQVTWHAYPMRHEVCLEEIQAIAHWLVQVLK